MTIKIGDLFERDITRAIPPVVYFHEQDPSALQREVDEYIITGGYDLDDPRNAPDGIHEQFVRLLRGIFAELQKPNGAELPACWISGFYGSGKSSFAKLLGLSLDACVLPDGRLLHEALLAQDHSKHADEFAEAWRVLAEGRNSIAVAFDVGSQARDFEQVHTVIVRQLQRRLQYSRSNLVAEHELKLELAKFYSKFQSKVQELFGKPWGALKDGPLAEDHFSATLHALQPELYPHEMSWVEARVGSAFESRRSADEAVQAIEHMMNERMPGHTLFIVVDEVSQYVHDLDDRMLALQSFVTALGQRMKGRAWLLATGQQKLEEGAGPASALPKLKDRFPPSLRVHLSAANIRDVVHKRLLRKKKTQERRLQALFQEHQSELSLYAYQGHSLGERDFVEVYPLLPGYVDLLLDITTGLRSRSSRVQGDSHGVRGLLQLLGDVFRENHFAEEDLGTLITIDLVYDILHSALDVDAQLTLSRALEFCAQIVDADERNLTARVLKAVALLELVQHQPNRKTDAKMVSRCLYRKLGDRSSEPAVQTALDRLVAEGVLGLSEKTGYRVESSAGQDWQLERDRYTPAAEELSKQVQAALELMVAGADKVQLENMALPWRAFFTDAVSARDVHLVDERKHTVLTVDFQFVKDEGVDSWVPRSDTSGYRDRIVWTVSEVESSVHAARKVARSARMIETHKGTSSLIDEKQRLLIEERNRHDNAVRELTESLRVAFLAGSLYFRGRHTQPRDVGATFLGALTAFGKRIVVELYPHPTTYSVTEKDILYLIESAELAAPPPVLGSERLGILELEAGRYEVTCSGRVPTDVLAYVQEHGGITGSTLLSHFGSPPYGVPPDVLRAAVVGLLRGGKVRVELQGEGEITSVREQGARELLKDTGLRRAKLTENVKEALAPRDRIAICTFFKQDLDREVARDNDAIADAVVERFASLRQRLTQVGERFRALPSGMKYPEKLEKLGDALETCRRDRRVEPTMLAVKKHLPALRDGVQLLRRMETDLSDKSVLRLRDAHSAWTYAWPSLMNVGASSEAHEAAAAIEAQLAVESPWEDTAVLEQHVLRVRNEARAKRRTVLEAHGVAVEQAIDHLKRRTGFERLDPDQRHAVLRHLQEGAAPGTDENAIVPPLEQLESLLTTRREQAERKALAELDAVLETLGRPAVVEVELRFSGREIQTEAELDRWLDEVRARVVQELAAKHRVRLRGA